MIHSPDPADLAELHASAFDRPWTAAAIVELLGQPGVFAIEQPGGFVIMRVAADEAEVLTLAVRPQARRRGLGRKLVQAGVRRAHDLGAAQVFLEVAEDNAAALALYASAGFVQSGRRRDYYGGGKGPRRDALLLTLNFDRPASLP